MGKHTLKQPKSAQTQIQLQCCCLVPVIHATVKLPTNVTKFLVRKKNTYNSEKNRQVSL